MAAGVIPDDARNLSNRTLGFRAARMLANQRQMPYGAKYINPQLGGPLPSLAAAILISLCFLCDISARLICCIASVIAKPSFNCLSCASVASSEYKPFFFLH
jgi:hypothetical protein